MYYPYPPRRRPSQGKVSPFTRFEENMSTPTGPAGGDLTGNYPNPQVFNLANAIYGPAIYPAGSAELLTNIPPPSSAPPSGPAGGSLTGTYPNPTIGSLAATTFRFGNNFTLDAFGSVDVPAAPGALVCIPAYQTSPGTGALSTDHNFAFDTFTVHSAGGAADAGLTIQYISY